MLVNVPNIKQKYIDSKNSFPSKILNYVLSGKQTTVAFISADTSYHSWISVLDINFNPLFTYETNAYIYECNISMDGNYVVWHTATSQYSDSNSIFLFDVYNQKLLWKINSLIHNKYSKGIYVFPDKNTVECVYQDITIRYDMNGQETDPENTYKEMLKSSCVSPYYWNIQAFNMIDALNNEFNEGTEKEIVELIRVAEHNPEMSKYQLSLTYKKLGDCYYNNNYYHKALNCYKTGLQYNEKLPVKRKILKLEKGK